MPNKIIKVYTIETLLHLNDDQFIYLDKYIYLYNKWYREMWHEMTAKDFNLKYKDTNEYLKAFCRRHNLQKRTVNTMIRSIKGRMKSFMELKKYELRQKDEKILGYKEKVIRLQKNLENYKVMASKNELSKKQLEELRALKFKLYNRQRKLNRLIQQRDNLYEDIDSNYYSICFGTKDLWYKQFNLKDNGYCSHQKWYHDFVKNRDKSIEFLGSAEGTQGNQVCQLYYDKEKDNFYLQLRKENFASSTKRGSLENYLIFENIDFKYQKDLLISCLSNFIEDSDNKNPLSYRIKRNNNRWYLQVMFHIDIQEYITTNKYGIIGLDFNSGLVAYSELNESGNLIDTKNLYLPSHLKGNKSQSKMEELVSQIVNIARQIGKDIAIENLDFSKIKSKSQKGDNSSYNKMLNELDYGKFKDCLINCCHRKQVGLVLVNPAYTSQVGEEKYGKKRKLSRHQAAAYVIGRLGMGFTDSLDKKRLTRLSNYYMNNMYFAMF